MGKADAALDIMHEAGILCCMLLFTVFGGLLMLRYASDGDFLPLLGGFTSMAVGAALLLRTPGRLRAAATAREPGAEAEDLDENALYDEDLVRVRRP